MASLSEAGLFCIEPGLRHEDIRARTAVASLLDRIRMHPAGRVFFGRLGEWANMGFKRSLQEKEATAREQQQEVGGMEPLTTLSNGTTRRS